MTKTLEEIMTANPESLPENATVLEAARLMKEKDIGDVIVLADDDSVCGIVTDRDIVVRGLADGKNIQNLTVGEIASTNMTALTPESRVGDAIQVMREKALRRLPVVRDGKAVGIVSIGDLAIERDPKSALADISEAPPNR